MFGTLPLSNSGSEYGADAISDSALAIVSSSNGVGPEAAGVSCDRFADVNFEGICDSRLTSEAKCAASGSSRGEEDVYGNTPCPYVSCCWCG